MCINCGFVRPVTIEVPKVVCIDTYAPGRIIKVDHGRFYRPFVPTQECHVEYETVTVENRSDLRTLRERINQVINAILRGDGLHRR